MGILARVKGLATTNRNFVGRMGHPRGGLPGFARGSGSQCSSGSDRSSLGGGIVILKVRSIVLVMMWIQTL